MVRAVLIEPQNIVVHPSGQVLVADNETITVSKSSTTTCPSVIPLDHMDLNQDSSYYHTTCPSDDEGMVYVTDQSDNARVQKFTLQGELVAQIKGEMDSPRGIAIDGNNILYVSNEHFVSMFDTNGKFLGKFGKRGSGDAEFNYPYGVVVDKNGDLYVCDWCNNRIVVY